MLDRLSRNQPCLQTETSNYIRLRIQVINYWNSYPRNKSLCLGSKWLEYKELSLVNIDRKYSKSPNRQYSLKISGGLIKNYREAVGDFYWTRATLWTFHFLSLVRRKPICSISTCMSDAIQISHQEFYYIG